MMIPIESGDEAQHRGQERRDPPRLQQAQDQVDRGGGGAQAPRTVPHDAVPSASAPTNGVTAAQTAQMALGPRQCLQEPKTARSAANTVWPYSAPQGVA
jgi:hypothetical protein